MLSADLHHHYNKTNSQIPRPFSYFWRINPLYSYTILQELTEIYSLGTEFLGCFLWCRRERECGADRHHPCVSVDVGRHPAAVRYRGEQGKCPFTQIPESSRLILLDTFLGYWMSIYFVMQNKERYINLRIVLNRKQNDPM